MINGSCYCGRVKFELTEPPKMMATCHCCRKAGASTFVMVSRATAERPDLPDPPPQMGACDDEDEPAYADTG